MSCNVSGLVNQGATCYINAFLQVLNTIPEFNSIVSSWKYNEKRDGCEKLCIPLQMQKLFDEISIGESPIETKALTDSFGWNSNEHLLHQDIFEFRDILFDNLTACFKGTNVDGTIYQLFTGKLLNSISSLETDYKSDVLEEFTYLNLHIPSNLQLGEYYKLEKCIIEFLSEDFLLEENALYDDKNYKYVTGSRIKKFVTLPIYLTIRLNRFDTFTSVKNGVPIYIPFNLKLNDLKYELCAAVVHIGLTLLSGHYFSYIKIGSEWLKFDDRNVYFMTETEICDSICGLTNDEEQAYMLLYKQL
jgi:ubiquitin C-terminal hydrolase